MIKCYVLLYIIKDKKILLQRRAPGSAYNRAGYYGLPGGKVEEGETFKQTAIREAYEEIGITIKSEDLEFLNLTHEILNLPNGTQKILAAITFVVKHWESEPHNKEPEDHDLMNWFALADLPRPFFATQQSILNAILKKEFYSEVKLQM